MTIHESSEDYLEAILRLTLEKGYARSVDVAYMLGVSKPSVSVAMSQLRKNGYIEMNETDHFLVLTPKGGSIASRIYERHTVLTELLCLLGVPEDTARTDACKVEHDLSDISFNAIKTALKRLKGKEKQD